MVTVKNSVPYCIGITLAKFYEFKELLNFQKLFSFRKYTWLVMREDFAFDLVISGDRYYNVATIWWIC